MSFKFFTSIFSLLALCCSCSSQDEPQVTGSIANPSGDVVEWSLDMDLPDEPKTRAAASVSPGTDGLYAFTGREINKLWYAVYYEDKLVYDCTTPEAQQPKKIGDNFNLVFKLPRLYDPTKVKLFFWAGNADDAVSTNNVTSVSNGINLNFAERCVSIDPKYVNGGNTSIAQYDSFCGYFQLANNANVTNRNLRFSLSRPFAQIHVLTNELTDPGVRFDWAGGAVGTCGFGRWSASAGNMSTEMAVPTTWFYDDSKSLNPAYKAGEYIFSQNTYEYTNDLANTWPSRTTFKNKDYHYLGCMLTFAPTVAANLKGASASGNAALYGKFNMAIRKPSLGYGDSTASFVSADIPSHGIVANNRYVVYNGQGPGPFSKSYHFEIVTDNVWGGATEIEF